MSVALATGATGQDGSHLAERHTVAASSARLHLEVDTLLRSPRRQSGLSELPRRLRRGGRRQVVRTSPLRKVGLDPSVHAQPSSIAVARVSCNQVRKS
jgi:hypothetical protein